MHLVPYSLFIRSYLKLFYFCPYYFETFILATAAASLEISSDLANELNPMSRLRRSSGQFGVMMEFKTKRSAFDYFDYGCYCGVGGRGAPVDGTDLQVTSPQMWCLLFC